MAKQIRPSISIRRENYARLKYFVDSMKERDPETSIACSNVVEAALTRYLDEMGFAPAAPAGYLAKTTKKKASPSTPAPTGPHPMDDKPSVFSF